MRRALASLKILGGVAIAAHATRYLDSVTGEYSIVDPTRHVAEISDRLGWLQVIVAGFLIVDGLIDLLRNGRS